MGRHASAPVRDEPRRGHELLLWGAFTAVSTVVLLVVIGASWGAALALGALDLAVFAVVWLATVSGRQPSLAPPSDDDATDGPTP